MQNVLPDLVSTEQHPTHLLMENVGGFEVATLTLCRQAPPITLAGKDIQH